MTRTRHFWTPDQVAWLEALYAGEPTTDIAFALGHPIERVYTKAAALGLKKSPEYLESPFASRLRRGDHVGAAYRFQKGHVPANKGLRRPGWGPGRMRETQFRKGHFPANRDPDFYVIGALRINADGYIDMRISFAPGACGWRGLHRILWEDAHGPVPKGHVVVFKDRDRLNVELDNLECISLVDNMKRNTVHNLPKPIAELVQLRGALNRQINRRTRENDRRPA